MDTSNTVSGSVNWQGLWLGLHEAEAKPLPSKLTESLSRSNYGQTIFLGTRMVPCVLSGEEIKIIGPSLAQVHEPQPGSWRITVIRLFRKIAEPSLVWLDAKISS